MPSGQTPATLKLQGVLGIDRAASLKEEIVAALGESGRVLLDLSLVEDLDLACLQVLYGARTTAKARGLELQFSGSLPSRVVQRLETCGFLKGRPGRAEDLASALVGC